MDRGYYLLSSALMEDIGLLRDMVCVTHGDRAIGSENNILKIAIILDLSNLPFTPVSSLHIHTCSSIEMMKWVGDILVITRRMRTL